MLILFTDWKEAVVMRDTALGVETQKDGPAVMFVDR